MSYQSQLRVVFGMTLVCFITFALLRSGANTKSLDLEGFEVEYDSPAQVSCRWFGICGSPSLSPENGETQGIREGKLEGIPTGLPGSQMDHLAGPETLEDGTYSGEWFGDERKPKDIPPFVLDYAPLVHLHSEEQYWPSTMESHLEHITARVDYVKVEGKGENRTVNDLHKLNHEDGHRGWQVYLDSNDNVQELPDWLTSRYGIPDYSESSSTKPAAVASNRSVAPAVLIIVEKEHGIVDAFWFYFYSYNLGNGIFGIRFGNHVGDWEHSMVRFVNGTPTEMFLSEHEFGVSYTFEAMEKRGKRPVIYSGIGTHAMYATPGKHPYIVPFGILRDETDKGPLWDPVQNFHSYHYDTTVAQGEDRGHRRRSQLPSAKADPFLDDLHTLTPTTSTANSPTSWFHFAGHWGGKLLPRSDKRQYAFFTERAYVSGPPGPKFKALGRKHACLKRGSCRVLTSIAPSHWILVLLKDWLTVCIIFWVVFLVFWLLLRAMTATWSAFRRVTSRGRDIEADADGPNERTTLLPENSETTENPV